MNMNINNKKETLLLTSDINTIKPDDLHSIKCLRCGEDKSTLKGVAASVSRIMSKPELAPYIYAESKYRLCFTQINNFRGKRFHKFVKKTEENLYNIIYALIQMDVRQDISLPDFLIFNVLEEIGLRVDVLLNSNNNMEQYLLDDIGAYIEFTQEQPLLDMMSEDLIDLFDRMNEVCGDNFNNLEIDTIVKKLKIAGCHKLTDKILLSIVANHNTQNIYQHLKELVYPELCDIVSEHLRACYVFDEDMVEANYNQYLPDSSETFLIFVELLTRLYVDASNYISTQYTEQMVFFMTQKEYSETYEHFIARIKEKDEQITKIQAELEETKQNSVVPVKKAIVKDNDINKALQEELRLAKKENEKLKKKIEESDKKYNDINEMLKLIQTKNQIEEPAAEVKEINMNKKYIFVIDNWTSYRMEIKKAFPNAEFIGSSINLEPKNVDMVILMPNHVGHPTYYSMKKQCKDKGIKFVHCNKTNIDEIKKVISQVSN